MTYAAKGTLLLLVVLTVSLAVSRELFAGQNWPQWRGPAGNGSSDSTHLPTTWSLDQNIVWKSELPSWSGGTPVIWGDRIFITSPSKPQTPAAAASGTASAATTSQAPASPQGAQPQRGPQGRRGFGSGRSNRDAGGSTLLLLCLSKPDGKLLWQRELDQGNRTWNKQNASSPSPVTDGRHVWIVTGTGAVAAFDFDGKEIWKRNLQRDYGNFGLNWGYASSPLFFAGKLIIEVLHGNNTDDPSYLVAFDGATGKEVWRKERPTAASCPSWLPAQQTPAAASSVVAGPRQMEHLGRGVVAVPQADGKVFVSWRLLGTDPDELAFNLYRTRGDGQAVKLNVEPILHATHYADAGVDLSQPTSYFVRAVLAGQEQPPSAAFKLKAAAPVRPYLSIPLQTPDGYTPNDASVGDLDGDGEYEIVLHQVGRGRDNSQTGQTTEPILEAYKLDGTMLWRINLGKNIREGAHYTQFMVYDLDGDGRAEMVCKTADGTLDGQDQTIGDASKSYVNANGMILEGPEFLTVFDGRTGAALATTDYIPARGGDGSAWGDNRGNRVDRFLACVAYLDGARPSVVMCRGYYTRAVLAAWDWRDGKLTSRWVFDSDDGTPGNRDYRGQGYHNLSVADVDGDGRDEIVYGACVIDDNGRGLYSTKLGHGDALHVSDLDPARPGLEVWGIHENERGIANLAGTAFFGARTGEVYFTGSIGQDVGRGMAADIDPRHRGAEIWGGSGGLRNCQGERIGNAPRSVNMAIWWDGDLLRELLDGVNISKWDHVNAQEVRLISGRDFDVASNNGTKSNPCLSADILGDWREELIARSLDGRELRVFTTTIPTEHRFPTLMHDPHYRLSVAWQNVAYNQPPHTGFYLGAGMAKPPRPAIITTPRPR